MVEGRLRCNHEQAIVLASYSLQVEIHLANYFRQKSNFPPRRSLETTTPRSTRPSISKTSHFFRNLSSLSLRSVKKNDERCKLPITIFEQDRLGALTDPVVAQHASLAGIIFHNPNKIEYSNLLVPTSNPDDDLFDIRIKSAPVAGIAQQLAEIYYIVGAQQLEGYGQVLMLS